jgi:hypothetical protein
LSSTMADAAKKYNAKQVTAIQVPPVVPWSNELSL